MARIFIPLLLIFYLTQSRSEENALNFRNLSHEDGVSSNSINSVYQDSRGRMWIGTFDGLNLYDGSNFHIYRHNSRNPNSLLNNYINGLIEDNNHRIFVGNNSGVSIYYCEKDIFFNINTHIKSGDTVGNNVLNFAFDKDSFLWMSSTEGLYKLNLRTWHLKHFKINPNEPDSLPASVLVVMNDSEDRLWVGTESKGLYYFDKINERFKKFIPGNQSIDEINSIRMLLEDSKGDLWVSTDLYLGCYETSSDTYTRYIYDPKNEKGPAKGMSRYVFEDGKKRLWVSYQYGLTIFDRNKKEFKHIRKIDGNPKSVAGDEAWCIMQDKSGNVWFGFFNAGISIFNDDFSNFHFVKQGITNVLNLTGNSIISLQEDKNNNIWVGIDHVGLFTYNPLNNKKSFFNNHPYNKNSLSSDAVTSIDKDHEGNLWLCTWGGGLNKFDTESQSFTHYLPDNKTHFSIKAIHTWKAQEDQYNNLVIATQQEGMSYYVKKENKFYNYIHDPGNPKSISSNSINCIIRDSDNNIFLGTSNGLNKLNYEDFSFIRYTYTYPLFINDIYDDNKGTIWMAASNSLYAFDKKTGIIEQAVNERNLPVLLGILEDRNQNLWISTTNNGLLKYSIRNKKILQAFTQKDGLPSVAFNKRSRLKLSNGTMLFGTSDGLISFHPDSVKKTSFQPEIIFTGLHIFNQPVEIGDNSVLENHPSYTTTITLDHDQSVFTIYFSALNYMEPSRNQYAYIMEGFEKKWNYVGRKHEATYTNLDPGEYIFKVKISVEDNIWSKKEATLKIVILPPVNKTWWFRTLVILLLVLILFTIYYLRMVQIRLSNIHLKETIDARTRELAQKNEEIELKNKKLEEINMQLQERQVQIEEQSEELMAQKEELKMQRDDLNELNITKDKLFSILGHDLRSPFNVIFGFSDLLYKNFRSYTPEKIEYQLNIIKESTQNTYSMLNNLLDWSKSQRKMIQVDFQELLISNIIETELRVLQQQAQRKDVILKLSEQGHETPVSCDAEMISVVVRNMISNAIKFSNKQSSVFIKLIYTRQDFTFMVKDEGVGVSTEKLENLFKVSINNSTKGTAGEKGTGLGLLICADFIEKHNGKIWAHSELGKGSVFSFTIPVVQPDV